MELNAENIIRKKVRVAESTPVDWNRERVWNNIDLPSKGKWNEPAWYSAAACVLIASLVLIDILPASREASPGGRLTLRESALPKKLTGKEMNPEAPHQPETPCASQKKIVKWKKTAPEEPTAGKEEETIQASPPVRATEQPDPAVTTLAAAPPKVIYAIVGVIPSPQEPPREVRRRKKLKIDLLSPEQSPNVESKSLTARLN